MKAIPVVTSHRIGFHSNTFFPSNPPMGNILRKAKKLFIKNPMKNSISNKGEKKTNCISKRKITDRIMLVRGPAIEIFPLSSFDSTLYTYTAPGSAITKPTSTAIITENINEFNHILYSAKYPYFMATNLWANSCKRNPKPTATIIIGKRLINTEKISGLPLLKIYAKSPDIINKEMIMSLIS